MAAGKPFDQSNQVSLVAWPMPPAMSVSGMGYKWRRCAHHAAYVTPRDTAGFRHMI
jgi:hypothetical protein